MEEGPWEPVVDKRKERQKERRAEKKREQHADRMERVGHAVELIRERSEQNQGQPVNLRWQAAGDARHPAELLRALAEENIPFDAQINHYEGENEKVTRAAMSNLANLKKQFPDNIHQQYGQDVQREHVETDDDESSKRDFIFIRNMMATNKDRESNPDYKTARALHERGMLRRQNSLKDMGELLVGGSGAPFIRRNPDDMSEVVDTDALRLRVFARKQGFPYKESFEDDIGVMKNDSRTIGDGKKTFVHRFGKRVKRETSERKSRGGRSYDGSRRGRSTGRRGGSGHSQSGRSEDRSGNVRNDNKAWSPGSSSKQRGGDEQQRRRDHSSRGRSHGRSKDRSGNTRNDNNAWSSSPSSKQTGSDEKQRRRDHSSRSRSRGNPGGSSGGRQMPGRGDKMREGGQSPNDSRRPQVNRQKQVSPPPVEEKRGHTQQYRGPQGRDQPRPVRQGFPARQTQQQQGQEQRGRHQPPNRGGSNTASQQRPRAKPRHFKRGGNANTNARGK